MQRQGDLSSDAVLTFSSLAIAIFVLARRFAGDPNWKGWAVYSIVTGVPVIVSFIAATTVSALDESGVLPGSPTGLLQRIGIIAGWSWIALLAIQLLGMMGSRESTSEGLSKP